MLSGGNVVLTFGALRALRTELFRVGLAFATPLRPFARPVFFAAICHLLIQSDCVAADRFPGGQHVTTSPRTHHGQCVPTRPEDPRIRGPGPVRPAIPPNASRPKPGAPCTSKLRRLRRASSCAAQHRLWLACRIRRAETGAARRGSEFRRFDNGLAWAGGFGPWEPRSEGRADLRIRCRRVPGSCRPGAAPGAA